MANDDAAFKPLTEVPRAARFTTNLWRAFDDLVVKLKRAYGQPVDEANARSQHAVALLAIAHFLKQMGPAGDLAHFANQFAKLAQMLRDLDDGIRVPMLDPAPVRSRRRDPTMVWLPRAYVALAVETMRECGHSRKSAAEWAAERYPGLKQLITESGVSGADAERSRDLEKTIISWCEDFRSGKVGNDYAKRIYADGLSKLKAWAPNRKPDQIEAEADRLLQEAVGLL